MQVTAAVEVTVNGWRQVIGPVTYETDERDDHITRQLCERMVAAVNAEVARNHPPAPEAAPPQGTPVPGTIPQAYAMNCSTGAPPEGAGG